MKKRKELNALIGLTGDGKKKKSKKSSGHQLLLRTEPTASESESSSDFDEFAEPASGSFFAKAGYVKCCKICYPLCAFVMLAACVVACVGLVWMQVALKEDLDALKEKFRTLESSQKASFSDIPKLNEDLLAIQKDLTNLDAGDKGISKIWTNITELNKQINQLNSAVAHLKANVKSASDLINLPVTVEELQKSVATIGSTLTSVQNDVGTIKATLEDQKKKMETLQQNEEILDVQDELNELNATLLFYHTRNDQRLQYIDLNVRNLSQRVTLLERNFPITDGAKIKSMNSTMQNDNIQVPNFRERLKVMVNALANKSANLGNTSVVNNQANTSSTSTVNPLISPRIPVKATANKNSKRNVKLKHLSLPGINSLKALQDLFLHSSDGQLSYQELYKLFGTQTPDPEELRQFDANEDGRFSQTELINAIGS
ncbi:EF-hand calcium-binding domain-containing protein 14 [Mobula hypostoma]|uniref:EF-hand calcium-binding domain-containing protein 14 n=1 Tax=Mobula hypostoma TaxID=723540 RepID=UPI002FC358BA